MPTLSRAYYSHLNVLKATRYTTTVQIPSMPISRQQLARLAPSNAILRMALLKCVSGSTLQMGWSQDGNASMEKKVPARKNCGKVIRLAKGGMELSFFDTLLTIKPNPMKRINARKLSNMMSKKVCM